MILAVVAAESRRPAYRPRRELQAALTAAERVRGHPMDRHDHDARRSMEKPEPAAVDVAARAAERRRHDRAFANGVEAWLKPTDFKNDQMLFALTRRAARRWRRPADYRRRRSRPRYVALAGVGGLKALDLQKLLAGKLASARAVHLAVDATASRAARRRRSSKPRCSCSIRTSPRPATIRSVRAAQTAARGGGRQPRPLAGAGVRRKARADEHVESLHLAAADRRARRGARPREDDGVLPRALLQRRRLHVLHGRRVQGGRCGPAAGAIRRRRCRRRDKAASTSRTSASISPPAIEARRVEKGPRAARPDRDQLLRRPADRSGRTGEIIAATTVLDIALRDMLREDLGQTYTVSVGLSQSLPQRGDGSHRGELRRRAREHRRR